MSVNPGEPRPRYKPYRQYKDSGVEWMGEIPAHWEVKRIKHVATKIGSGKTPSGGAEVYLNEGIMLVRSQNVHFGGLRLDDVAYIDETTDREMATTRVLENDVLLNITGASLGRCCLARLASRRANVNQHVCIIRPRQTQFDPSALSSALASDALQAQIFNNENGISRDALNFVQIGNFAVCKPTLEEQRAITAFLDRETARIDGLVAKKERLIELLQEKRSALITRAVTKGLDPNVPMKDSGVEWLGEIPAHWEVKPLRWAVSVRSGEALPNSDFELDQEEGLDVSVVGGNGVMGYTNRGNTDSPCIAIGRVGALCGNVHLVDPPAWVTDNALVISDLRGFDRKYLSLVFIVLDLNRWASQNAQPLITGGFVKAQCVCSPPRVEQGTIATHIDRETAKIDALVSKVRTAIDRLRELRTALISAAVTGKIDVRQEAP